MSLFLQTLSRNALAKALTASITERTPTAVIFSVSSSQTPYISA